jgi:hypothetical protein
MTGHPIEFRHESEYAQNFCSHRRPFIDFRLCIGANDPYWSLILFDQQNYSIFFFDQSQ